MHVCWCTLITSISFTTLIIVPWPQVKGFGYMLDVAQSKRKKDNNIIPSAQYNVGRAYFMVRGSYCLYLN